MVGFHLLPIPLYRCPRIIDTLEELSFKRCFVAASSSDVKGNTSNKNHINSVNRLNYMIFIREISYYQG